MGVGTKPARPVRATARSESQRHEFGADFISSQRQPISAAKRVATGGSTLTYEKAVATEIAKGCSPLVAEQRVLATYGNTLPRSSVAKGDDTVTTHFMKCVDSIMLRDNCDRTDAMRKARQENEAEFAMFQLV
jgi:hypothetical protein